MKYEAIIIFALCIVQISLQKSIVPTVDDDCPKFCTFEYEPICGVDNTGNTITFGNKCDFKIHQCENRDAGWKILNTGECNLKQILDSKVEEDCPKICTLEYVPVCGVDNTGNQQTFGNLCSFKSFQCENRDAGWKILSNNDCQLKQILKREVEEECPKFCTLEYAPICGMDNTGNYHTFGNLCSFKSTQCENRDAGWKILSTSECQLKQILKKDVVEECPKFCTLEYAPICGMDNTGNYHTFGNLCSFKSTQCENRDAGWKILSTSECQLKQILKKDVVEECPKFCTLEYAPVCGMDNTGNYQTFGNLCSFQSTQCENRDAGWKILSTSECQLKQILKREVKEECPKFCTLEYAPICGMDSTGNYQTFGNLCSFKSTQCENRDAGWKILSNNECQLKQILKREVEEECPKFCTLEYAPICGMDNTGNYQTFGNLCSFKSTQCENRDASWKILSNNECQLKQILKREVEEECPKFCTLEYAPICGMDSTGNYQTFGNLCSFKSTQCENRDAGWKILSNNECQLKQILKREVEEECPKFCTLEYAPICGMDNTGNYQTFGNLCSFKSTQCENRDAGWKILSNNECQLKQILKREVEEECPKFCTLEYAPICGMDSTGNYQTFGNLCSFKSTQCENRDAGWKILSNNECQLKQILKREVEEECPKFCTLEYAPICGMDSTGNYQTFGNLCSFKSTQCENRDAGWKILSNNECQLKQILKREVEEECPKFCTLEYAPICGMDNTGNYQTFGNLCSFKSTQCENRDAGWKILSNNECQLKQILKREVEEECPKFCTLEYAPICGMDNTGNYQTFGNLCSFKSTQCENRDAGWKILSTNECQLKQILKREVGEECPKFCTLEYAPVCGMDNTGNYQTFGNLCSFKSTQCEYRDAGWKILSTSECQLKQILKKDVEGECPKFCTLEYVPVCGVDSTGNQKTFGNLCFFKNFQCENRDAGWKILSTSQCELKQILETPSKQECPKFCTLEYAPVCGMDNTGNQQTFGNLCSFKSVQCENRDAGWKILSTNQCQLKKILDYKVIDDCPKVCTLEFVPICGVDNTGNRLTFGNKCFFEVQQCENRAAGWKILHSGVCETELSTKENVAECPKVCTLEYAPVCGVDNTGKQQTFSNLCFFKSKFCENRDAEWEVSYRGVCKVKTLKNNEECPKACTKEYVPVCGIDNTGNQQTFSNLCTFKRQQCENRDAGWKILSNGPCKLKKILKNEECPKFCTEQYAPVCGVDNTGNYKSFSNKCFFDVHQCENRAAGWKVLYNGVCKSKRSIENKDSEECPKMCTLEYAPICGMDSTGNQKTFGSMCSFKSFQCENRDAGWKILNNGDCRLRKTNVEECPKFCTLEYAPVCGMDNTGNQKTFGNMCSFKSVQCENRDAGWKVLNNGDCRLREANAVQEQCPKFCTLEYVPVCGMDNTGNQQTFSNKCFFEKNQCENRASAWQILHKGTCEVTYQNNEKCSRFCTLEYAPICATDNTGNTQTFSNKCFFKTYQCENRDAGWKMLHAGKCLNVKNLFMKNECPKICTLEYNPVCGIDNSGNLFTFANKCFFKREQCENRAAGWKISYDGECQENTDGEIVKERACNGICTREYAPVCGLDEHGNCKTFGNKCMFEMTQCEQKDSHWKLLRIGEC